ncbi:MAG: PQQ-binding-like beta-propeller repeat protein [Anaerolineaceae bacterium]|nr:PQQ-binding-like beta-propeller repeat protein [Anaerolineaceae bacterium]
MFLPVLLVVLASAGAAGPLVAQAVNGQVEVIGNAANGQARAAADDKADKEASDEFRPELNTSVAAENLLRVARNLTAAGAYSEAGRRYLELVRAHPDAVSSRDGLLYLPIWRTVIEDVLAWPAEGLQEFRNATNAVAREQWRAALGSGRLRDIEQVAHQQFLSDVGDDAMVALGDRLRESGYPALALYYYKLVLDKHPSCDIPGDELILRATLAARESGLAELAHRLAGRLGDRPVRLDVRSKGRPPAQWLADQPSQAPRSPDPSAGLGVTSDVRPVAPATHIWQFELTGKQQSRGGRAFNMRSGIARTSAIYPTLAGEILYAAHMYSAWAIDTRSGRLLWRHDTRDNPQPVPAGESQARQPLVVDDVVYVPLEDPLDGRQGVRRNLFGGRRAFRTSLYALSARSGLVLWKWDPRKADLEYGELSVEGMPVVSGDVLIVALGAPGTFYGEIYTAALDRHSGRMLWSQPIAGYPAGFVGQRNAWNFRPVNVSASVAVRGGLVFSNGLGVTAVQSIISGRVLWARKMKGMRQVPYESAKPFEGLSERLVNGFFLARLPRLLVDRGAVATGCCVAPDLEAYDWLDGRLLWRRKASGAVNLLAVDRGRGVAWGSSVMVFDMLSGQPAWPARPLSEPATGEPAIARGKLLVPVVSGVTRVDLATGKTDAQATLPPGSRSGNLAVGSHGLIVVTEQRAVSYLDWDTARRQFLAQAAENPEDAGPLVSLGAAALRLEKTAQGLDYLDQALARAPEGQLATELYQLYEDYFRQAQARTPEHLVQRLLDRMKSSARDGHSICRQAFLRAEYYQGRNARRAIAALREILDVPGLRHILVSGPGGPGVSGILAEKAIARLVRRQGRAVYKPWETAARAARRQALAGSDYDGLIEVACRWPNSTAARKALDDALGLALGGDPAEANRLLIRMVNLTPEGDRKNRYRALLLETSQRLGLKTLAELQAQAISDKAGPQAIVRRLDGTEVTVEQLVRNVPRGNLTTEARRPPAFPDPPYRLAWTLEAEDEKLKNMQPVPSVDSFNTRGILQTVGDAKESPLFFFNQEQLIAVDRSDGSVLWSSPAKKKSDRSRYRYQLGRQAIYGLERGELRCIDPATGAKRWQVRLQPQHRRQVFESTESVTGALRYGDTGFNTGSKVYPNRVTELGDTLAVATSFNLHLIDLRDGYTIQTISYPSGIGHGGFQLHGRKTWGIPLRPARMKKRILIWDIATGDLEQEVRFGEALVLPRIARPGSRFWPIFNNAADKVAIMDVQTGRVGPLVALPKRENTRPRRTQRTAVVHNGVLLLARPPDGLYAVSTENHKVLWNYAPKMGRSMTMLLIDDRRLLVSWGYGIAMLRVADGDEIWKLSDPAWRNATILQRYAKRFVLGVRVKEGQRFVSRQFVYELATGERIFTLARPDGRPAGIVYADDHGLILRRRGNAPIEYWVSDPEGEWKDVPPQKPEGEDAEQQDGDGAPGNAPGGVGLKIEVRVNGQAVKLKRLAPEGADPPPGE